MLHQCYRKHHHCCCSDAQRCDWLASSYPFLHCFACFYGLLLLLLCCGLPSRSWFTLFWVRQSFLEEDKTDSSRINTYIGASCMLIMLESIWPSFRTYPNRLPLSAGVTSNKMIAYFVFWICECTIPTWLTTSTTATRPHSSKKDALALLRQVRCCRNRSFRYARLGSPHRRRWWASLCKARYGRRSYQIMGLGHSYQYRHLRQDHSRYQHGRLGLSSYLTDPSSPT